MQLQIYIVFLRVICRKGNVQTPSSPLNTLCCLLITVLTLETSQNAEVGEGRRPIYRSHNIGFYNARWEDIGAEYSSLALLQIASWSQGIRRNYEKDADNVLIAIICLSAKEQTPWWRLFLLGLQTPRLLKQQTRRPPSLILAFCWLVSTVSALLLTSSTKYLRGSWCLDVTFLTDDLKECSMYFVDVVSCKL